MKKHYNTFFLYFLLFVYLEFINKILMFNKLPNLEFIYVLLTSIFISLVLYILSSLFKEKTNKIITHIIVYLTTILYLANYLYFSLFQTPFSVSDLGLVYNAATDFLSIGIHLVITEIVPILLFLLPLFFYHFYYKHLEFNKNSLLKTFSLLLTSIFVYFIFICSLSLDKNNLYSAYNLYYNIDSLTTTTEVLGVFTSERLSIKRQLFGFQEKVIYQEETGNEEEISYNELDIDFNELLLNETNEDIKTIYNYLNNQTPTNKNEYTGIYQGKNLIFILAEGFNSIAVDEYRTPTLYKLINEGFNFTNYYSPVFLSTTGGEFQAMTSLIPTQEILSLWRKTSPKITYSLGNAFSNIGYNTYSFHDWTYTYYGRDKTMSTLGFPNYLACGNGLENRIDCSWVPSDVDLINTTFNDYASNSPFVAYYITVSGHAPYNFTGGSSIALKNKEVVDNLDISNSPKAYLSTQMELEYALNALLSNLESAGILDDTVIVLTGDHYPYTLTESEINEISTYPRDEIIEVNHSNLIIWNTNNEYKEVDKVASQIDVLPTILNLFGIDYDSRLLIGNDIFSNADGLAIFSNRSWVTNKGKYYQNSGFESYDEEVSDDYINTINMKVANSFTISKLIIENDFYSLLESKVH